MFTGIVETLGVIASSKSSEQGSSILTIAGCASILSDAHDGDSISVNGTCLTITSFKSDEFTVSVSPETLRRTNLSSLEKGQHVNLERAVSATTRMGGHFVQGHVDTVASIISIVPDGDCLTFRLQPRDKGVLRYIIEKGYVTLDGASLTITRVNDAEGWYEVMLITYTQAKVVMGSKAPGSDVNVEVDMVGKYVEKGVHAYFNQQMQSAGCDSNILESMVNRMVDSRLKERSL